MISTDFAEHSCDLFTLIFFYFTFHDTPISTIIDELFLKFILILQKRLFDK